MTPAEQAILEAALHWFDVKRDEKQMQFQLHEAEMWLLLAVYRVKKERE